MTLPLSYNWRNLLARRLSSSLTFVVVAVVVFVLTVLLSFAAGVRAALATTGDAANILVLKPGATAESTSVILPDEAGRLVQAPGIASDGSGQLLISPELSVQTTIPRIDGRGQANVAVRGVDDMALQVHPNVRIVEGRWMRQGAMEIVIGRAAQQRFANTRIGDRMPLGRIANRVYEVVGVFDSGGNALESELWAPRSMLVDSYERRFVSSVALRLADPARAAEAIAYINGPAVSLAARRESDYYAELTDRTAQIVNLAVVLVGIMAVGAVFAVANTMYATVDSRRREIAMLRTIGFSRGSIYVAFVIESVLLCTAACLLGLLASLLINGRRQDFLSDTTWTVMAYELRVTPAVLGAALLLAALMGVAGAFLPAWRAARTPVIQALRRA